ncbi:hypothetical protein HGI47_09920 [Novosphingobium sp. ERN07]|uniref:hypothetical protein n=1 Tax=Novosphingobium sp. ERN07 TaxID=2726187 RepID=UPI0014567BEC|nr:hypothetical protein [Novosphingobium sp. ERN07]NLR71189.1 hypothetical protein [Novosphingobium sp. ERN07]
MTDVLRRTFADITARLEEAHSLAVEGQNRDNTPDMHRVIIGHLVNGLTGLHGTLIAMSAEIDRQGV